MGRLRRTIGAVERLSRLELQEHTAAHEVDLRTMFGVSEAEAARIAQVIQMREMLDRYREARGHGTTDADRQRAHEALQAAVDGAEPQIRDAGEAELKSLCWPEWRP